MGKRRRRKTKKNSFVTALFLFLVLIILMSYASFLLYSFAKNNGLLQPKAFDKEEKNKISETKKENNIKLDLVSKLFKNQDNKSIEKNYSNYSNNNSSDADMKTISNIEKKENTSSDINSIDQPYSDKSKNQENNNTNNSSSQNDENKSINSFNNKEVKQPDTKETKNNQNEIETKINSKNFIIYLAALDKNYELYLAPKTEKIDYTDSPIFSVITFLINYKPKEPYLNLIPEGTKLLGAWIKQGILYLNFNKNFLNNNNGLKSIEIQIYQIVNTAMQFNEVQGVRFLIEGKRQKYYSDEGFLLDITFKKKQFSSN